MALASVPTTPVRAICYLRQSTSKEESISLELQETACRDHCTRNGYTVTRIEADPGISGRTWKRPAVRRVIASVQAGDADVVVLWKWSRLARNRRDWAVAVDMIETVGGRLESATEPVDATTSAGRLARGMLAEFAAFESERIGDGWRETQARRVKNGLPGSGKPRWGYRYVNNHFEPDPVTGPVLVSLYQRYVSGESIYGLVKWLNDHGYRTSPGYGGSGVWSDHTLRRVLDSGFAAGLINSKGNKLPGTQPPLINDDLWTRYLAARPVRRQARNTERSQYLLSGLMRCECGSPMSGGIFTQRNRPYFRCIAAVRERRHPGGFVLMHVVEDDVMRWLEDLAADVDLGATAKRLEIARAQRRSRDAQAIAREILAVDKELARLTDGWMRQIIPESAYVTVKDETEHRRRELVEQLSVAEAEALHGADPTQQAVDLLARWDELSVALRRGALKNMIGSIVVTSGMPRAQVQIVPLWGESRAQS